MTTHVRRAIERGLGDLLAQGENWQRVVDGTDPDVDTGSIQDDIAVLAPERANLGKDVTGKRRA
jgi:hypothetical protein